MANRFDKPQQQEYVSQYVPMPLDYLSGLAKEFKVEKNEALKNYDVAATDIKPGLATAEHAKYLNEQKNKMLEEAYNKAAQSGDYSNLNRDVTRIANVIKSNPLFEGIQRDIAQTKRANEQRYDPNFKVSVQDYTDEKGNIKQLGLDQPFDESYYNVVKPGNTNKEYSPLFQQIKPIISKIYEEPVTKSWVDENGITHSQTLQEGVESEGLRRNQVRNIIADYIQNDPNALNADSRFYSDALSQRTIGRPLSKDEHLDEIANAFMGEFKTEKQIQKLGAEKLSKPSKDGSSGSGGLGMQGEGIPNAYVGIVAPQTTQLVDEHLDGLFRKADDGAHIVPLRNSIANFAKVTGATPEQNKLITFGDEFNKLYSKVGLDDNPEKIISILAKQDPENKNKKQSDNDYWNYWIGVDKVIRKTKRKDHSSFDRSKDVILGKLDNVVENYIKTTPDFKILADAAKEQGVDMNNPNFTKDYKNSLGKYSEEVRNEIGKVLELGGEGKFVLDQGDNKINVDDKAFVSGKVIMTESQLNAAFEQIGKRNIRSVVGGDWGDVYMEPDGAGYGIINTYGTDPKTGENLYSIDTKQPIQISRAANKTYNKNVYTSEYTKNANNLDRSFDDFLMTSISNRRNKVYSDLYEKDKKSFDTDLNNNFEQNSGQYAPQFKQMIDAANAEKDPSRKKQALIRINLILKDPESIPDIMNEYMMQSSGQSSGKVQGGWTQTPATPLK